MAGNTRQPPSPRPTAITIHDDCDMSGQARRIKGAGKIPILVPWWAGFQQGLHEVTTYSTTPVPRESRISGVAKMKMRGFPAQEPGVETVKRSRIWVEHCPACGCETGARR